MESFDCWLLLALFVGTHDDPSLPVPWSATWFAGLGLQGDLSLYCLGIYVNSQHVFQLFKNGYTISLQHKLVQHKSLCILDQSPQCCDLKIGQFLACDNISLLKMDIVTHYHILLCNIEFSDCQNVSHLKRTY